MNGDAEFVMKVDHNFDNIVDIVRVMKNKMGVDRVVVCVNEDMRTPMVWITAQAGLQIIKVVSQQQAIETLENSMLCDLSHAEVRGAALCGNVNAELVIRNSNSRSVLHKGHSGVCRFEIGLECGDFSDIAQAFAMFSDRATSKKNQDFTARTEPRDSLPLNVLFGEVTKTQGMMKLVLSIPRSGRDPGGCCVVDALPIPLQHPRVPMT
jgi:hypothetical protein